MNLAFSLLALLCLGLAGCSSEPEPVAKKAIPSPEPEHVADHTSLFPNKNKLSAVVVPHHILDMKKLPGGSLAEYEEKGQKYQLFIVEADTNQNAAFMMLDMKAEMKPGPEYLAHMGGYFGMYGDKPLYCFAKKQYVAGVIGLPKAKADPLAIELAAQLH